MNTSIVLIVVSSFGLHLAALLGVYILFSRKYRGIANQLLALLLIALALRTGKAIFYNFMELPAYLKNLALGANLAAAPLLYFYGRALVEKEFVWNNRILWHFLPALVYVVFAPFIPSEPHMWWWKLSYSFILLQSYLYVAACLWIVNRSQGHQHGKWIRLLALGLGLMWIIYGLVFIGWLPYHIAGSISFSILMVLFSFLMLNKVLLKAGEGQPYSQSKFNHSELHRYHRKIKQRLSQEELYLQSDLTVERLANHLGLSPRIISETINRLEGQNFVSFVNRYRIVKAQLMLHEHPELKIAAIAYECGFNSLSAFNQAFKSQTDFTPSQYRTSQAK